MTELKLTNDTERNQMKRYFDIELLRKNLNMHLFDSEYNIVSTGIFLNINENYRYKIFCKELIDVMERYNKFSKEEAYEKLGDFVKDLWYVQFAHTIQLMHAEPAY